MDKISSLYLNNNILKIKEKSLYEKALSFLIELRILNKT
jgi:hypothetical protein